MGEELKPCEIPCPKCGGADVHRLFRARGDTWQAAEYGKGSHRYGSVTAYHGQSTADHIHNQCRCCAHVWQTRPLPKTRKSRTPDTGDGHE